MPFTFNDEPSRPVSIVTCWAVENHDALVEAIAWLYLQKRRRALDVIHALDRAAPRPRDSVIDDAIIALKVNTTDLAAALASREEDIRKSAEATRDTRIEHRDGLLFQHLSWIAAHLQMPSAHAAPPHVRQADKGFDGVFLEFDPGQERLARVVLCEDKASINPRPLVTRTIWPDIRAIQADKKDREILAAVTAILDTLPGVDQEAVLDATEWQRFRHFRVALTAGPAQLRAGQYHHLFAGFDAAAGGEIESRMGEVLPVPDVRAYLADLAADVVAALEAVKDDV